MYCNIHIYIYIYLYIYIQILLNDTNKSVVTLPVLVEGTVIIQKSKNINVKILITWQQNKSIDV